HREVWLASDTAACDPSTGATLRLARASTGMTTSDRAARTMPGKLAAGSARASRSRVLATPTQAPRAKKLLSQIAGALGTAEAVAGLGHALGELALADGDAAGAA